MSLLKQINQLITGYAIGVFILVLLAVVGKVRERRKEGMNINELEGRELDAKMAKLMGWRLIADHPNALTWEDDNGMLYTWFATSYPNFRPSTDIAAAWLVVEKMREKGRYVGIETVYMGFRCEIGGGIKVIGDTAPLAICRAALKATEAE